MENYTFEEMADMHVMYARAYSNCYAARRLYAEAFPHRQLPDSKTFESVDRRLRERGKFYYFFFVMFLTIMLFRKFCRSHQ